jgi:hypothetical protein
LSYIQYKLWAKIFLLLQFLLRQSVYIRPPHRLTSWVL